MSNKKPNTPRRKRLNRPGRLLAAKAWLSIYKGKNLVRGYAKNFGTDLLCAISELRTLGFEASAEYEQGIKRSMADRAKLKQQKKEAAEREEALADDWQDENFSFIAGYTGGGAPYCISRDSESFFDEQENEIDNSFLPLTDEEFFDLLFFECSEREPAGI
jgi:hypothetical protein